MLLPVMARFRSIFLVSAASAALSACASLPNSGPTAGGIERGAKPGHNDLGFTVRNLTPAMVADVAAKDAAALDGRATLASLHSDGRSDVVGPGDVLTISVYEVGVGLFGGGHASADGQSFDPSARAENFPAVTVDRDGTISLPYARNLSVAGRTLPEVEAMLSRAYRGQSQNPQVLVDLKENVSSTVYVSGAVGKPGRIPLTLRGERVLDAVALAGGTATSPEDTVIRFSRGRGVVEERFDLIRRTAADDLALLPGDRIEVIKRPRSFLVMGATAKVAQIPFENSDVSLGEAIARVGGPSDSSANPAGIFVFRFEPSAGSGHPEKPVIYRLNMMDPASYFLAQRFAMRDKDVVYISNSPTNALSKFVTILSQLFSPVLAATYAIRN